MPRIGVSFEEVSEAAESLLSKGENPTIEKVRLALGSRGSNSTISKYMAEWRAEALPSKFSEHKTPITTPDPVNRAVNAVWEQIQAEKETAILEIKNETEAELDKLRVSNSDLEENLQDILNKCEELSEINNRLNQELESTKHNLSQETKLHELAKAKIESLESNKLELEQIHNKVFEQSKQDYADTIEKLEKNYKSQIQNLENEINNYKTKAEDARHQHILELDKLKTENLKLNSSINSLNKEKTDLETSISTFKQEMTSIQDKHLEELDSINAENKTIKADNIKFGTLLETANSEINNINKKIDNLIPKEININDSFELLNQKINAISKNIDLLNNSSKLGSNELSKADEI